MTGYGTGDCRDPLETWWRTHKADGLPDLPAKAPFAGLDSALLDLEARRRGVPVHELLDLPRAVLPTSMTVSLDDPGTMAKEARDHREAGFTHLKVKVGEGPADLHRLEAVRDAVPEATIRVDANGGWTPDQARQIAPGLARLDVELVEQPVPPGRDGTVADLDGPPVYADESLVEADDLDEVAGLYDGVVVKTDKHGGPRPTRDLLRAARDAGLGTMIGCNVTSSLGILAGVHLLALADRADLDGALLLADDGYTGPVIDDGRIGPPDRPGLGAKEVAP